MSTLTASPAESQRKTLTSARFPMLLFFDGECAFCNRWVNRVLQADKTRRLRVGTKQGKTFQQIAQTHPELARVDSIVLVTRQPDGSENFLVRSPAIHQVIQGLPEFRFFDLMLTIFPTFLTNIGYRIFSKLRTPLFGKWSHCRVPLEEEKELFVD